MLHNCEEISTFEPALPEPEWISRMEGHQQTLSGILDPYLDKRSRQIKDPVLDFLFEYYAFRPSHLKRWSPGLGTALEFNRKENLPEVSELGIEGSHAFVDPALFPKKRLKSARWILDLLKESLTKKPMFGCFGMHEWAMVYRTEEVRHGQIPLRLPDDVIAEFVESRPLVCTHFDAFRFFTEKAKPLNKNSLSRENFQETEQPGCLHTNMDLYKWAFKLYPWISSDLIREAFLNAVDIRKTDMQASPYDAREFGLEPIKIETEAGRKEYLDLQTKFFESSQPIRKKLIESYERVIQIVESVSITS